jgi:hypothetical protein
MTKMKVIDIHLECKLVNVTKNEKMKLIFGYLFFFKCWYIEL